MKLHSLLFSSFAVSACILVPSLAHADSIDCDYPTVEIVSPEDGAAFEESPSLVTVILDVTEGGYESALSRVRIEVDGVEAAAQPITTDGRYTLSIEVVEGTHEVVGVAEDDCAGEGESEPITIVVTDAETPAEPDPDPDPDPEEEDDGEPPVEEEEDNADEGEKGGCAVARVPTRSVVGLSAFGLLVLGAWRLRRKEAA